MTVTLNVQSDEGDVADANGYITLAYFKSYHGNRGNDYSAYMDDPIKSAIIKATDYIDTRFAFKGIKLVTDGTQTTEFPRQAGNTLPIPFFDIDFLTPFVDDNISGTTIVYLVDPSGQNIVGIPIALQRACAEYSFRALSAGLFVDARPPEVDPMPGRLIDSHSVSIGSGAVSESVKFAPAQSSGFIMPAYPAADLLLARAGLILSGRQLVR